MSIKQLGLKERRKAPGTRLKEKNAALGQRIASLEEQPGSLEAIKELHKGTGGHITNPFFQSKL